ncbi:hypothetical protein ACLK1T_16770 [Escherichia coli]
MISRIQPKPIAGEQSGAVSPRWKTNHLAVPEKAGSSVVVDVLRYGERLKTPGRNR